ncbi:hypothetical protein GE09DRAFT_1049357 [Coniochaeta sp. 2T2.1]|nr:hypothetical protein GE09DRAFT_1049357 [Coniochaeta sp. 2T2.1]
MADSSQATESPNTDAYAKALKNIQETTTTATGLLGLYQQFRGEFGNYHAWSKQIEDLKEDLGEWALMVYRPDKSWWLPVLRTEPFEEYLADALGSCEEGALKPAGDCKTSVGCAKLLHALALRPTDTPPLEWRRMGRTFDATYPHAVRLEVESRVLCHIVNLFKIYDHASNTFRSTTIGKYGASEFRLSFGAVTVKRGISGFLASFRESSHAALSRKAYPFDCRPPNTCQYWARKVEKWGYGTAYMSNRMALEYGISPTRAALSADADHHKKTRKECAEKLIHSGYDVLESEEHLYLLTRRWINDVVRIWRRVTVNPDGQDKPDPRLIDILIKEMCSSAHTRELSWVRTTFDDAEALSYITEAVKTVCMFDGCFEVEWSLLSLSYSDEDRAIMNVQEFIPDVLPSLKGAFEGEWNVQLGEMIGDRAHTLARVLGLPRAIVNAPTLLMELSEGHELWDTNVLCYVYG